jgi:diguanylate cyclase (GGDEF)-like protein
MKQHTPSVGALRHSILLEHRILDTPREPNFDDVAVLAAHICQTPVSLVTFVEESRIWIKAGIGLNIREVPNAAAFCDYAVRQPDQVLVVRNAAEDTRFARNRMVSGPPKIRFYAGVPLTTREGVALGTLCVLDTELRELTNNQLASLRSLADQLILRLELRRAKMLLRKTDRDLKPLTIRDDLTGLYNRRGFFIRAERAVNALRSGVGDKQMWLLAADINEMETINREYGHPQGSLAIKRTGEIFRNAFRKTDIVARISGDEFGVLLIDADEESAEHATQRIHKRLNGLNRSRRMPFDLHLTVGSVQVPFTGSSTTNELLVGVENVMYETKTLGRPSLPSANSVTRFPHIAAALAGATAA